MVKTISNVNELDNNCLVIIGSENCVACKQIFEALNKDSNINAYYIDIKYAYAYINTLRPVPKSLPIIIIVRENAPNKVLVGNMSINKIRKEMNNA